MQRIEQEISEYQLDVIIDVIILIVTIVVSAFVSFLIYKISNKIDTVKKMLQEKTEHLEKEQSRTESLLSQLVPAKIAKRMQSSGSKPEFFDSVTIMYADICDVDSTLTRDTPIDLISMVNDVFDVFEKRVDKYNVSKLGCSGRFSPGAFNLF